ncbi:MAG: thiamine-phosphate kinase [Wenzhouxiangella sp.]
MPSAAPTEFELIARIRSRVSDRDPALLLGIGDDAAVVQPSPGQALVITTDSLVVGRHFGADWRPVDIGHLALAVNLSDLAAMGATPRWAMLALTLPQADARWLDAFLDGFLSLAEASGCSLIGGNIAAGPLNLSVQLIGEVAADGFVRRQGAQPGDALLVTGSLGDAAAALKLGADAPQVLQKRLRRPEPRLAAGRLLAAQASAMLDVSDGLLADLGHLLGASLGAEINLVQLPTSVALRDAVPEPDQRWLLQLSGGNDYELLLTAQPGQVGNLQQALSALGVDLTEIGRITATGRVDCLRPDGSLAHCKHRGWDHFDH